MYVLQLTLVKDPKYDIYYGRYHRLSASLAVTIVLFVALFRFWPASEVDESGGTTVAVQVNDERIQIEEIRPTRQGQYLRPPPPAPPPPVVVPDDIVLETPFIDLSPTTAPAPEYGNDPIYSTGDSEQGTGTTPAPHIETPPPILGPRPIRFVEPEYTREARKKKVRAEVVVEVTVGENGNVEGSRIVERFLIEQKNGLKKAVQQIGFGLEEAALAAAQRWQFRPASQGGAPVRSSAVLTFRFGV